jgi:hypothetical protein
MLLPCGNSFQIILNITHVYIYIYIRTIVYIFIYILISAFYCRNRRHPMILR